MSKYRHAKGLSPMQILIIIGVVVLSLALIGGGAFAAMYFSSEKEEPTTPPTVATPAPTTAPATVDELPTEAVDADAKYTDLAKKHLENMSLDEKIYQMLVVTPEALTGVDVATAAGDATKTAIEKYPVSGIYYSANNFEDATQTTEMIKNSQSYAKTAMLIAVAEEGGENAPVASKLNTTKVDFTFVQDGGKQTFENASTVAKDLKKFGINTNFAPSSNIPADTKPEIVGENVVQAVKGYKSNFVVSAPKYFPVSADSTKPAVELEKSEFVPFVSAIKDGADAIILSPYKASQIEDAPAFMSKRIVTDTLTMGLQFNGVIITPNLSDEAITGEYDNKTLARNSIDAGVDILLCPNNIDEYYTAIKEAFESGEITKERIDNSVTKILALKYKYGILEETPSEISNTQTAPTTAPTTAQ